METPCTYLKDIHYRKDDSTPCKPKNILKFVRQKLLRTMHVMLSNQNAKWITEYLKILNEITLLLVTPNGKRMKNES